MKNIRGIGKNILGIFCVLIFLFLLSLFFSNKHTTIYAQAESPVVISEISAYEADNHEWVEIYNRGSAPVDLLGWTFWEGGVNHKLQLAHGVTSTLDAHAFAIIAEDSNQFILDYPGVNAIIFDSSWGSLNESGEEIGLKNAVGEIVELFTFLSATEHSLERVDVHTPDYTDKNWIENLQGNTAGSAYEFSIHMGDNEEAENEAIEIEADMEGEEVATSTETVLFSVEPVASSTILIESPSQTTSTEFVSTTTEYTTSNSSTVLGNIDSGGQNNTNSNEVEQAPSQRSSIYEVGNVVINELVSNPQAGATEFVELKNISNRTINLEGWYFEEGSGAKTYLEGHIEAEAFYVIEKPKGSLNNTGDELYVFDSWGRSIDKLRFGRTELPAPDKGEGLARDTWGEYVITNYITKGKENEFSPLKPVENKNTDNSKKSLPQKKTETIPIKKNFKTKEKDGLKIKEPESVLRGPTTTEKIIDKNVFKIRISEFMPNPAGADDAEFIELFNPTTATVSLYGLIVDDEEGGSKPYTIMDHIVIKSGAYFVLTAEETGIVMNNTNDEVRLFAGTELIDVVSYSEAKEEASYALVGGKWQWSSLVTPSAKNMVEESEILAIVTDDSLSDTKKKTKEAEDFRILPVSSLQDAEVGAKVEFRGTVTVLPGVFGSQYFYIHDTSEYGVEIYVYSKKFPALSINDLVSVRGVVTESNKRKRIKVAVKEDIRVVEKKNVVAPAEIGVGDIGEEQVGNLVQIRGEIVDKKKSVFYLDDGSGEIAVSLKKGTDIKTDLLKKGDFITISGIVVPAKDGFSILPRSGGDILFAETPSSTVAAVPDAEVYTVQATKHEATSDKNILISFGVIVFAGILYAGYKLKVFFADRR